MDRGITSKYGEKNHFLFFLVSFLLSGFIGYLANVREMVADWSGEDDDSEQLFFTRIYIDAAKRVRLFPSDNDRFHVLSFYWNVSC